ncbi:hypothetical protein RND71_016549 [Anisodus tanguticus]|uniref:C2H2-type domain-containing protein n=1 Tax=Anisodus tanguticus TaxID=243964 RepID=A0AAE1S8J6_9SOLA|nr:hypothetical protein RND71_016549 [Anisodus tanguticus]
MSMEKYKCKLCSKKFLSGKALGGHMRYLTPLPLPPRIPPSNQDSGGRSHSTLSLSSSENQEMLEHKDFYYGLRENPKKRFKIIDTEFLDRSKRGREMVENEEKVKEKSSDFGPLSLFSDCSSEEDIAMCLMMLSRDKVQPGALISCYARIPDKDRITKIDSKNVWKNSKQNGKRYQCVICHKMFKTSQALGSHKTIHKEVQEKLSKKKFVSVKDIVDKTLQECPFCGIFFESSQALGGHKRTHLVIMSSSTTTGSSSSTKFGGDSLMEYYSNSANLPNGLIDLNMPAPMEDTDFQEQEHA